MTALALDFAPDRTGPPPGRPRRLSLLRNDFPDAESGSRANTLAANAFTRPLRPAGHRPLNALFGRGNVAAHSTTFGTFYSGSGISPGLDEAMFPTAVCRPSTIAYISGAPLSGGTASFDLATCNTVCISGAALSSGTVGLASFHAVYAPLRGGSITAYSSSGMVPQVSLDETTFATAVCSPSTAACFPPFSGEMVQQVGLNVNTYGTAFGAFNGGTTQQATANAVPLNESASVDPGPQAVDLHPSLSLCLRAIYERQSVLTEAQAAALKRQLRVLLEDEEELQSANINVSIPSLHRLIDFLSVHQTSALPSLSITRAGYFAASWSPRKRAKLTIVFRPEGVADWIASDLNATPPVHQKDTLANRLGEFAAWTNA
jgi:hypothetical protein